MTLRPITIERTSTLAVAHRLMAAHGIRHLPVVDKGRLVGVLIEHDLRMLESIAPLDPDKTYVHQAMSSTPFVASPEATLDEIVEIMAERKHDAVVVVGRNGVEGIFTAIDACQALATILRRDAA